MLELALNCLGIILLAIGLVTLAGVMFFGISAETDNFSILPIVGATTVGIILLALGATLFPEGGQFVTNMY